MAGNGYASRDLKQHQIALERKLDDDRPARAGLRRLCSLRTISRIR
jgi:hypothetical protein